MAAETMTADNKRVANRQRVIKAAKIISLDRATMSDCSVKNVSATGAQIVVESQTLVPKEFYFYQPKDHQMCSAKVVWRREKLVGIHFTSDMGPPPASLSSIRR
jgi:PilZ domain